MSRLIDMGAWDNQQGRPAAPVREIERAYVLVADAHAQRTEACLESIKPFNVGVRIARDGEEAVGILQRFGSPILLITDLSLSRKDGFAVIEALRGVDRGRAEIIAWSSFRGLREFAAHRLAGLDVRVLGSAVAPAVLRSAIERALRGGAAADTSSGSSATATAEDVYQTMTELSQEARHLCGTAGVAVYFKASGETQFRASVTWTSDAPIPRSQNWMPRVFGSILETGEAFVSPDLTTQPVSDESRSTSQDVVRGLVAVPIMSADQQIVGTICVFDVKPLTFSGAEVEALKALGRRVSRRPAATPVRPEVADRPLRAPEAAVSDADESAESPSLGSPIALLDRRGGDLAIARELIRMRREQRQLSVILFDVDPLGPINGGAVNELRRDPLVAVSETLARAVRGSDLAIRWSQEKLLVVLPGLSETEARQVAERVRAAMQAGARHGAAVSGGVAELLADDTFEAVVARANEKVRLARDRGHNRLA